LKKLIVFATLVMLVFSVSGCYAAAGAISSFLDASEAVTDKNGDFEIPEKSFLSIPYFRKVKGPFFTIFKPSYGAFPEYQVNIRFPDLTPADYFETKGAIVELPKLKTKEDRLKKLIYANEPFSDHNDKKKKFIHTLNSEFIELGLVPYKEEK
jgi:hypothetical protein